MKLWKHLRAQRRRALEASVAPGADIHMGYEEAAALVSHTDWHGSFRCEHMQASGVRAFTCGICGPLEAVSWPAVPVTWTYR